MDGATAGGPLREREHETRDQSVNDKAQSDVMGVKERVADGGVTGGGGRDGQKVLL